MIFRNFLLNRKIRKSEKKWGLYNSMVKEIKTNYFFKCPKKRHIKKLQLGFNNTKIIWSGFNYSHIEKFDTNTYIYLHKQMTEELIINTLIHEDLHTAINMCLGNGDSAEHPYVETIINHKLMGKEPRMDMLGNFYMGKIN